MTQEHPITPPPELVRHLIEDTPLATGAARELHLINAAYCAGADMELEACCEWVEDNFDHCNSTDRSDWLRAARRPKPPSLKEQALWHFESFACSLETLGMDSDLIRRALEALPD